jgi:hypothetical protein
LLVHVDVRVVLDGLNARLSYHVDR